MGERFPLYRKANGQWAKKHRGRTYYFGAEKNTALKRYVAEWPDILAGRPRGGPEAVAEILTVGYLANSWLEAKRRRVESGEMAAASWANCHRAAQQAADVLGRERLVADLGPADFGRLRAAAAATRGPNSLALFLALVRGMFRHATELTDRPVRFGDHLAPPARKVRRLHRTTRPPKLLDAPTLRMLLAAADPVTKAQALLALNAGFGATDCSELTGGALTRPGWVALPRKKTGVPRRAPLWAETQEAIRLALAARPEPADPALADRVFLSPAGLECVRFRPGQGARPGGGADAVARGWRQLCERMGVSGPKGFYCLRHVHRTISDGAKDQRAADVLMGHARGEMSDAYVEGVADERLQAVVDHVRAWLFGSAADAGARGKPAGRKRKPA